VQTPLAILAISLGVSGALCSTALADADPPSDVLLSQNSYSPYTVTQPQLSDGLNEITNTANTAGYKIRVAVIGNLNDLGSVPDFLDKPQPYATFLSNELSFGRKNTRPLLAVMKAGYGYVNITPKEQQALKDLKIPADADSNTLVKVAIAAVPKLSTAAGHPIKASSLAYGGGSGGGPSPALIVGVPAIVLAVAGLVLAMRRGRPDDEESDEDEEEEEGEEEQPVTQAG
jgi:hypothetical protein